MSATSASESAPKDPALVGRDDEVWTAQRALGEGRSLILVEGEAGIGKSRLVTEILRSADVVTRRVLMIACLPLPDPFPLGAVVDGIRQLSQTRDDVRATLGSLTALGGALRSLFPEWAAHLPPPVESAGDAAETRHLLRGALSELVAALEIDLVVVEDAHWSDAATLEWLLTLLHIPDGPSVVVTYRPAEVVFDSPLVRLRARGIPDVAAVRLVPKPLGVYDVARLAAELLQADDVSDEFACFLQERTDGLPLAVEESLRLLRERHDIELRDGQWVRRALGEFGVPASIRDSVLERVGRMQDPARRLLEAAAVLAEPASSELLAVVAHVDAGESAEALDGAVWSGLLSETRPDTYTYRHALDAQAVLENIASPRLRELHRNAGQVLRRQHPEPVVRLAHHAKEAGDLAAWRRHAERLADLAIDTGDDQTAVLTLVAILASLGADGERRRRLIDKLDAARAIGGGTSLEAAARVVEALERALGSGDFTEDDLGTTQLVLGRFLWGAQREQDAYECFETAVSHLAGQPTLAIRAMSNLAIPMIRSWHADQHRAWLDRAHDLITGSSDASDWDAYGGQRAAALLLLGDDRGWLSLGDLTQGPHPPPLGLVLNIVTATFPWGRLDRSRALLDGIAEPAATRHLRYRELWLHRSTQLSWYTGDWGEARRLVGEVDRDRELYYDDSVRQYPALLDLHAGDMAALTELEAVADLLAASDVVVPEQLDAAAGLARIAAAGQDFDRALAHTRPQVDMIERRGVWFWVSEFAVAHVDALIGTGDLADAGGFVRRFSRAMVGSVAPAPRAALAECRAALLLARGEAEHSTKLALKAAAQWRAMPRLHRELLALERAGTGQLAASREAEAVSLLDDVHTRMRALGASWDADRVARTLRAHGARTSGQRGRRGPRGYGDELSPRELEVLQMVARGLTNREVGNALFLSPKTVGLHLGSAMRKLNVHTRTSAAMAAAEEGLIPAAGPASQG